MTRVDEGQEVGLEARGLNHRVCEEKADVDKGWPGIEAMPCSQTSPRHTAHRYSTASSKVITLRYLVRILIFFISKTEPSECSKQFNKMNTCEHE